VVSVHCAPDRSCLAAKPVAPEHRAGCRASARSGFSTSWQALQSHSRAAGARQVPGRGCANRPCFARTCRDRNRDR